MENCRKGVRIMSLLLTIVLLFAIGALMYVLNRQTPLCRDDYSYSYTFAVKENKFRITNIKELVDSQINHYKVMNGRAVTHTLAQTFLMFDKSVFDFFNALVFVWLVFIVVYHALGRRTRVRALYCLAAFLSIWSFTPAFGDCYLWLTGSCNYLWGITIILTYMLLLEHVYEHGESEKRAKRLVSYPFVFASALIAGFTNENTSASLVAMGALFLLFSFLKRRKLSLTATIGLVGNICGFLLILFAPGQGVRLDANGGFGGIGVWLDRATSISCEFFEYYYPLLAVLVVLIVLACALRVGADELVRPLIFLVGTLVSVYSMVLSPYFPTRVWSGTTILLTLTVLAFVGVVAKKMTAPMPMAVTGAILLCCFSFLLAKDFAFAYADITETKNAVDTREQLINAYKERGDLSVELESIRGDSRFDPYVPAGDLNEDSSTWPNTAIAMYYGLDEVKKAK